MPILSELLDQVIELLENPQYKTFGDLQRGKYQRSKPPQDKEWRREMWEGTKMDPEKVKKGMDSKMNKSQEELDAIKEKAKKSRMAWYQNPENKKKFLEKINKHNKRVAKNKTKKQKAHK